MEFIPSIRAKLAKLDSERGCALVSGQRAALWRAQQHAARVEHTLEDLRDFCLESLSRYRQLNPEHENDYLRGYRTGFQAVLRDIRRVETR